MYCLRIFYVDGQGGGIHGEGNGSACTCGPGAAGVLGDVHRLYRLVIFICCIGGIKVDAGLLSPTLMVSRPPSIT